MPRAIAARRGVRLDPLLARRLGRGEPWLTKRGCLLLPLKVALWVVKRVVRKLLYVLAVADAAESLSAHWHRAYLLDHLIRSGHLDVDPQRSLAAFELTVAEGDTSPLVGLARQVAGSARSVLRLVLRARRAPVAATTEQEALLRRTWSSIGPRCSLRGPVRAGVGQGGAGARWNSRDAGTLVPGS
jgi:hypothetical protein